jgi:hypothetical protein
MKVGNSTFYLVGQITSDPQTYQWRKNVRDYFEGSDQINFYDPCNNVFSQGVLKQADGNVESFRKSASFNLVSPILPIRDASYVFSSDGCVANMNIYTPDKPFIGTFFELAWYKMKPEKLVIGIFNGDAKTNLICWHPFVQSSVHLWVKDEYEACSVLQKLYCKGG